MIQLSDNAPRALGVAVLVLAMAAVAAGCRGDRSTLQPTSTPAPTAQAPMPAATPAVVPGRGHTGVPTAEPTPAPTSIPTPPPTAKSTPTPMPMSPPIARDILVTLYHATNGPGWANNGNWLTNADLGQWYGVSVGDDGSVTGLVLENNQLTGHIPPELAGLSNLAELDLSRNQLTGPIPPELAGLSSLTGLYLWNNLLTGPIPTELAGLPNLTKLSLGGNQLTGPIPPELAGLSGLTYMWLGRNQLTGPIPPELSALSDLTLLSLEHNQLTGTLPPELADLSNLELLDIGFNWQLTGPIPPELANLSNLKRLLLGVNELTGPIPPELANLSNLTELDLGSNYLTGSIPPELADLSNLTRLDLGGGYLTGSIPPELGDLSNLEFLDLGSNQITGPIPPELGGLSNLKKLHIRWADLTGPIPPELAGLSNLEFLDLGSNLLTGPVPPELAGLSNLEFLELGGNLLTGPIPLELAGLSNLQSLDLGSNLLTGPIPPELAGLSNLWILQLGNNQLTGPIPPELAGLYRLGILDLGNNQLTGPIPPEVADLWGLKELSLAGNQLTGCVPPRLEAVETNDLHALNLALCKDPDLVLSAGDVLDAARVAAIGEHSGRIEGDFTVEVEYEGTKYVLSMTVDGVFHTPASAHLSVTRSIQHLGSVDMDGSEVDADNEGWPESWLKVGGDLKLIQWSKVGDHVGQSTIGYSTYPLDEISSQGWTEELIWFGDHVYVLDPIGGDARHRVDGIAPIELPFELFDLFEFDLLDSDGEISKHEQELDGESVYYLTGPAAKGERYPVPVRSSDIDGEVDYWIGMDDHLLRRVEISVTSDDSWHASGTLRLSGFVTLSDYGMPVDIQPPAPEEEDDHGNTPATATEITVATETSGGDWVEASVDSWLDSDYFRFQAEEGRVYHIFTFDEVPYDRWYGIITTVLGPDGTTPESVIDGSGDELGSELVWQAPASETYYLAVESGQRGMDAYSLTVIAVPEDDHGNTPGTATEISVGESVDGTVGPSFDTDYFRFQAEEDRFYVIAVSPYGWWDGKSTTLLGHDGITPVSPDFHGGPGGWASRRITPEQPEQIFFASTGSGGTRAVWRAPASGTHYLKVEGYQQGVDPYTLTITPMPEEDDYGDSPSTAHEILVGEAVEGVIGSPDDQDFFKLTANEGQVYRMDVSPHLEGNFGAIALYGPSGQLRQRVPEYHHPNYMSERILWVAPSHGDYYISAGLVNTGNLGSYTLTVISITDIADDHSDGAANATALSIGETVSGALDYQFDLDYFKFRAEEGQRYRLYISRTSNAADLRLYGSGGFTPEAPDKYTQWDPDGYGLLWVAREGGTYYLEVKDVFGYTGEYTITVTAIVADPDDHGNDPKTATDISIGEIVQGQMDHEFDLDYFRFMAVEGQRYRTHVDEQTLDNSTWVKVYVSDGVTETTGYTRWGATQEWRAATSSEHFFEVGSRQGSLGTYTIVVDEMDQ